MTDEKRVPIPERYKDSHTLLKAWTDAGRHPKTEYTTFVFAQEIVKYFEELGAAEAERDQAKAELAQIKGRDLEGKDGRD